VEQQIVTGHVPSGEEVLGHPIRFVAPLERIRGRIVLAAGLGKSETAIAAQMRVNRKTVRLWRDRFAAQGLPSLWEIAPGRGRQATYQPSVDHPNG
jgi:hypothetical protein